MISVTTVPSVILYIVTEVINDSGVALNSQNIEEVYNLVVCSEKVNKGDRFGCHVTYSTNRPQVGKLCLLNEKHSLNEYPMDLN